MYQELDIIPGIGKRRVRNCYALVSDLESGRHRVLSALSREKISPHQEQDLIQMAQRQGFFNTQVVELKRGEMVDSMKPVIEEISPNTRDIRYISILHQCD